MWFMSELLVEQNGVFMPASRGWSFIQSSKIYCNIEPPPTEIQVVDVETGKAIATVAGFEDTNEGVRIAGQSYKFLPGTGAIRKVRSEGEHLLAPKYHAKKLPRSYDLGMAAARSLNLPEDRLAILQIDGLVVVMTWLGSLMNHCLSAMMKRERIEAFPTAFAIRCSDVDPNDILLLLHRLVTQLKTVNPLGNLSIERLADLGPYFRELSDELKNKTREDWLDPEFFCNWINRIKTIDIYTLESPVADDLIAMASD